VDEADTAEVLTSELVTNAVRHADGDRVGVDLQADGEVRVAVSDQTQALPVLQQADASDTQGRGIAMVHQLARRWGVELRAGGGKVVWFELSARRATAAANRIKAAIREGATATSSLMARVRKARRTPAPVRKE
jgi:two-component sensor histidine kinase